MPAGEFDRIIEIQQFSEGAEDAFGETEKTWVRYMRPWAKRMDVSDQEKVNAGQASASRVTRFKIRSSRKARAISTTFRISYDDAIWNIHGIKETSEGRNRFLEITAAVKVD